MVDCPVPEIGEALAPFIRPRQEVLEVRNGLQSYLEKNLKLEDEHLTINNLASPPIQSDLADAPSGLTGVRKAYWNALKAHQEAQARYAAFKAELQELSRPSSTTQPRTGPKSVQEDVLPLLRQREKQRKLNVVGQALSGITNDENVPTNVILDDFIKSRAGEMPVLPNVSSTRHGYLEDADTRTLELKKAILTAQHLTKEHQAEEADAQVNGHSVQSELYALQQTRNMLIHWIERQLTIVGNAQAANEKPMDNLTVEGEDAPIPVSKDEIGQIYGQYLAARKKLLQALQHPQNHAFESTISRSNDRLSPSPKTSDKPGAVAAAMLPYIELLLDLKRSEDALVQHTTSARKQLSSAEAEADRLIRRLADESHLVVPGASSGKDWQKASDAANKATTEAVESRLAAGGRSLSMAKEAIPKIHALSDAFREP